MVPPPGDLSAIGCGTLEKRITPISVRQGKSVAIDRARLAQGQASDVVLGTLEPVTVTDPDSHTDLLAVCNAVWDEVGVPKELTPVCEDNGDNYCINEDGEIVFWSGDGASDETWPDLGTWIEDVWIGESE